MNTELAYIYINHKYDFEVLNLIKAFLKNQKIEIVKDKKEFDKNKIRFKDKLFLQSILNEDEAITKVELNEIYLEEKQKIGEINIFEEKTYKREKIALKKTLFNTLKKIENYPKWGILTGIRPVKIYHSLKEKGVCDSYIYETLTKEYLIDHKKADLLMEIGRKESKYIYPIDKNRYSLYIGIPFCPSRCVYCSFKSIKYDEKLLKEYLKNLEKEIELIAKILNENKKKINTVYIGGGTPSVLSENQLERLLEKVRLNFNSNYKEFTFEAGRPDTINLEKLKVLKKYGVNRISINPQSMNEKTLINVNRVHSSKDIIKKFQMAKELEFESINMDVIIGLPGEEIEDIRKTMKEIAKLYPENLTIHTLAMKTKSELFKDKKFYSFQAEEVIEKMLKITEEYAKIMKLEPYYLYRQKQILGNFENIGYSKRGKECIYNIMMMEEKETIIALGVGSVSKIFYPNENIIKRVPNFKDLLVYSERLEFSIEEKKNYILSI